MTSQTYSASSSAFFFATIPCQGFVSLHAALAHSMSTPTWNGPLHLLLLQLEPAELNCIKVPLEVRKTNCEAHLIFSLCFGCLWLVLCQIRPEGPSKAVHVAILLFLFDPFSMGLSSTFSGWKALIPRPAYRVTCGKPWVFDWFSCTLDPVKSPMSLSKSPCLWCCLRC